MNVLVIGPWGTGKTTFAATFPAPIYFFDMDMGLTAIDNSKKEIYWDRYVDEDVRRPTAANAIDSMVNQLVKECPYRTIVFDTTTNLADILMNRILALNGRAGKAPEIQDYGKLTTEFKNLVYRTKALKCHTVFVAHEHVDKDETTGAMESRPLLTNKLASRLGSMFNEVYYTGVVSKREGTEYRLLTGIQGIRRGKTQLGKGGIFDLFEEPNFDNLMAKVEASRRR